MIFDAPPDLLLSYPAYRRSSPSQVDAGHQNTPYLSKVSLCKVESAEDFVKSLNIDASVSLQVEFGKGGAKASFVSNLKMHDYSLYIAATVTVKTGTRILQTPTLDDQAAQLLTAATTQDQFRKMYGDVFLAGITQGGELIVFMEIQTNSQSDFENVDASIRGGDLLGLNQGSAHLQSSLQSIASNYQLTIHQFQRGGADLGGPLTPETVAAKASSFANTVTGNNVFDYLASFQTYDVLPRPAGANPIQVDYQRQQLQRMGLYQLRYTQLLNSIEYVLFNPNQFEAFDDTALVQKQKELNVTVKPCPARTITVAASGWRWKGERAGLGIWIGCSGRAWLMPASG